MRLSKWFSCACAALVAAAGATTCPAQTYVSTSGPTLIPDNLSATANLTTGANMANVSVVVPDTFNAASVVVTVGITHTFDGDVAQLVLVSPAGTVYTLKNATGVGSTSDNFKNTTFDNTSSVTFGGTGGTTPPFRSRFKGTSAISGTSTFASAQGAGIPVNGTWIVRAADSASGDAGTIDYVVLSFNEVVRVGQDGTTTNQTGSSSASPSQTGLNLAIPDNSTTGVSSTATVAAADALIITGVDLSFSVTHANLGDLRVKLVHPSGASVDVVVPGTLSGSAATPVTDGGTPNTANRPYATLVSDGAAAFSSGSAPYRGKFAPVNALAAFNGIGSSGTWTLKVFDEVSGTSGTVREWTLHIRGTPPVGACCNAGVCTGPVSASTCTGGGGVYVGDASACGTSTCDLGACCNPSGACVESQIPSQCSAAGSVYQGAGTTCAANPCPTFGRCCVGTTCSTTYQTICTGAFTGGGSCTPNLCTKPCCDLTTGTCSVVASSSTCSGVVGAAGAACSTITCAAPANDLCVNAQVLSGSGPFPLSVLGQNASATDTTGISPSVCVSTSTRDVWYSFTPTAAAAYSFTLCNAVSGTLDTVLTIHSACPVTGNNNLDTTLPTNCNDDGCSGSAGPSAIGGLNLTPGTTYLIRVSMFSTKAGGPFRLDITTEPFGACCDSTSTCTLKTQSQCVATSGSIFIGGGTLCSTSGICNGACCVTSTGSCTFTTAASCTGTHGGIGSTCSQAFCPSVACCNIGSGACTVVGAAGCPSGSTATAATSCTAGLCPTTTCCNTSTGTCTVTAADPCPSGTVANPATSCSPTNPCPIPVGQACANPIVLNLGDVVAGDLSNSVINSTISCSSGVKGLWYSFTAPADGSYLFSSALVTGTGANPSLGLFSTCGGTSIACVNPCSGTLATSTQSMTTGQTIVFRAGGCADVQLTYNVSVTPVLNGACCNASTGACSITAGASVCGSSNFYQGDNSTCPGASCAPVASCCNNSTGACTLIYGGACASTSTQGASASCDPGTPSSSCPSISTCCNTTTGACTIIYGGSCASGTTAGTGTACGAGACPATGGCCVPATGVCTVILSTACSGTYFGDGSTCAAQTCPNQSCAGDCAPGATCSSINGGFESGDLAGWTKVGTSTLVNVFSGPYTDADPAQTPHGGTYALAAGPTGNPPASGVSQVINAAVGAQVTIKFWYLCNPGDTVNNEFVASFDGATLLDRVDDTSNTTWTQFTFTVTVSTANPTLSFLFFNSPDYTFLDDVSVCVASPGVCCRGSTCSSAFTSAAACSAATTTSATGGPGWAFVSTAAPCNAGVNADGTYSGGLTSTTSPCCFANYNHNAGLEVQDIFDFLNDWFAGRAIAIPGGDGTSNTGLAVQNIFNFLNAWFAGGCN
jgi:subtilisin-like proprotein convertase family protein